MLSVAERVLNRYIYLFYPQNDEWLNCSLRLDDDCVCVDEVQLNIACLLFNRLMGDNDKCRFEFNNYMDDSLYHMKIYDTTFDLSLFKLCPYCELLKFVDGEAHKNQIPSFVRLEERRKLVEYDESIIVYLAFCLLNVNRDKSLHRSDILRFYFLKNQNAFFEYLQELKKHLAYKVHCEEDSLLFHIELIEYVLRVYALNEQSNILGDIFKIFEEPLFCKNYDCEKELGTIRRELKKSVTEYDNPKLPIFKVNVLPDITIISVIASIATVVKENYNWDAYKNTFNNIHNYLNKILESQKRLNETRISRDMTKLQNIIIM